MKITTIRLAALATMLAAASFGAHAAETADLAVQGMIRPSACNVSLSGNGTVDFGTISAQTLSETAATVLPARTISLAVSCDAATAVGITTFDGRAGTADSVAGNALPIGANPNWQFGIGSVDGRNIGAFSLQRSATSPPTADGNSAAQVYSDNNGSGWAAVTAGTDSMKVNGTRLHGWAASGENSPGSFSTITQPLRITLAIGRTGDLPALTNSIPIDGLVTIALRYL